MVQVPGLPDGQITPARKNLSSPRAKNISLFPKSKISRMFATVPPHQRGVSRSSRTWGGMRWTRSRRQTTDAGADGQAVWSWRSEAGAKFLGSKLLRDDGGNQAMVTGESAEYAVKTIARGRPGILG